MAAIWSDASRFRLWQEIEVLACEARAELGQIPRADAQEIRARARVEAERVLQREQETHHDVAAFVDVLSESIGPASRHVHFGLTSSDVLDTALAVQIRDAGALLLEQLAGMRQVVRRRALEFKHTPMVGRTHGIHAEPMTFGLKLLHWYAELGRVETRLRAAVDAAALGKMSGAVGTFAHLDPGVEAWVCARLGIGCEALSTQVVPRDRHAGFLVALGFLGACLERVGTEIRHLHRTEVDEVEERFEPAQKGSSAMPHKRNPIRSERLVGLARLLRSYTVPALENVSLWHERDISHSSIERVMLPDACLAADYMLDLATRLVDTLVVHADRMRANLEATRGLVFSQTLLLALVQSGMLRDEAYRIVQRASRAAWEGQMHLRDAALQSEAIVAALGPAGVERALDLAHNLRYVDALFERGLAEEVP
jgi:adenylosuccinate lyase